MEAHTHNIEDKHIVQNGKVGERRLWCTICAGPLVIVPARLYQEAKDLR